MSNEDKLGTKMIWLFGLVTLAVAIIVTYLIPRIVGPLPLKAMAGVYGVVFGAGAAAAAFMTRANVWAVIGSSAVTSLGLAIFYYIVVGRAAASVTASLGGSGAASTVGMMSGMIFAVVVFFIGLAASVAGALFGRKLRDGRSAPLLVNR
ncbi:MAG: hypothetical protein H0V17_34855 [Deltaproteobacteria bacterium]|nr:hypothetical protein [Deltaproteobacteria bacterium]